MIIGQVDREGFTVGGEDVFDDFALRVEDGYGVVVESDGLWTAGCGFLQHDVGIRRAEDGF